MIRIVVPSSTATRGYEFKGQRYSEQEAAAYTGGHFPVPFHLTTKEGNTYPAGEYTLDPACIAVNEKGRLFMKSVRLLPTGGTSAPKK